MERRSSMADHSQCACTPSMVQVWLMSGSGVVQVWFKCSSGTVPSRGAAAWLIIQGARVVQVRFRCGPGVVRRGSGVVQ